MSNPFYKKSFRFLSNRYEEWQGGQCISEGLMNVEIIAQVEGNTIYFELKNKSDLNIRSSFEFQILNEDYCILPDRIQYINDTSIQTRDNPIVCNIFYDSNTINYVRFAMTNPDRLLEFYGKVLEVGQNTLKSIGSAHTPQFSSEAELKHLQSNDMYDVDPIMDIAVKEYNKNSEAKNIDQARNILECLKMFVKAYELEIEKNEDSTSLMTPKILMFIALCNYKISNINQAYCVSKLGLDAADKAMEDSAIKFPKNLLGTDTFNEIITTIDNNKPEQVKDRDNYKNVDPTIIDSTSLEEIIDLLESGKSNGAKPTQKQIKDLIEIISNIQKGIMNAPNLGEQETRYRFKLYLDTFKFPLYFAWRGYGYGWHTDFCEEGESLFPYMVFESDLRKNTQDQLDTLKTNSPFAHFEPNSEITNMLIAIYSTFIKDIDEGNLSL